MINVLIVDDQEIVRTGLCLILRDYGKITSITEASTGEDAVQKRPEALGLIAICLVGGFQNSGPMAVRLSAGTAN